LSKRRHGTQKKTWTLTTHYVTVHLLILAMVVQRTIQTSIPSGDGEMWNSNSKCITLKDRAPTPNSPVVYVATI